MSTRCVTLVMQSETYPREDGPHTERSELFRFYRHFDGYPEEHGADLASSVIAADEEGADVLCWVQHVFKGLFGLNIDVEVEERRVCHGDIAYLYVIDCAIDHRTGIDERLPITISVFNVANGGPYEKAMSRSPIFSGTAYDLFVALGGSI